MTETPAADRLGEPVPIPPYVDPAVWARFCSQVVIIPGGCHLWTGRPRDDGYGQFWAPRDAIADPGSGAALFTAPATPDDEPARPRVWRAHRFAYAAHHGPLEETQHLMHRCDEPLCVPITGEQLAAHIAAGDNLANVDDRERKGRGTRRGRHGIPVWSRADRRGQAARSLALHQAITAALVAGCGRATLAVVIAAAAGDGQALDEQLTLFPQEQP